MPKYSTVCNGRIDHDNLNRLRQFCIAIGLIQKELALNNIWVRGGISSGNTYFDEPNNQIIGPAYIKSYLLEEEVAIFPRVVLDSKIIRELNFSSAASFIDNINEEENRSNYTNWGEYIIFRWNNPDGTPVTEIEREIPLFIDYLSPYAENNNTDLLEIISNIEKSIYSSTSIYPKYRWIADYLKALENRERLNDNLFESEASYRLENI